MLYQIVQTKRGEETLKMVDTLQKCNDRLRELRSSYHGKKGITFRIEKSPENKKSEAKPHSQAWRAGGYAQNPPRIK